MGGHDAKRIWTQDGRVDNSIIVEKVDFKNRPPPPFRKKYDYYVYISSEKKQSIIFSKNFKGLGFLSIFKKKKIR